MLRGLKRRDQEQCVGHGLVQSTHHNARYSAKHMTLFTIQPDGRCILLRREDFSTANYQDRRVGNTALDNEEASV
jgi:hypothetical protein